MNVEKNNKDWAFILLAIAPLFWSGNFVLGRLLHNDIPPFTFAFYRWLIVIILLFPFVYKSLFQYKSMILENFFPLLGLSFLSISVYNSFLYWGLHYTTVINAGMLNATVPICIMIISGLCRVEKVTKIKTIAATIAFIGAFLIISRGNPLEMILGYAFNLGDLIIIGSALSWSVFSVWYKQLKFKLPPFLFLFITAFLGDLLILPIYGYEIYQGNYFNFNLKTGIAIFYAGTFSSIVAFTCWNKGVVKLGVVNAGYFFNLLPVFSASLAVIFLKESMNLYHVVGILLVFFGILLSKISFKSNPVEVEVVGICKN